MNLIVESLSLVLLFTVIIRILISVYKHLSLRKTLECIPQPHSLPFVGMALQLRKLPVEDFYQWMMDLSFTFKNGIFVTWLGTTPNIHIRKPHQMALILKSHTLITKSSLYDLIAYWLGDGLLTSTGDKWHRHRKLINPAFNFDMFNELADVSMEMVPILNDCIKRKIEENKTKPVNVYSLVTKFTLDVSCKTMMGIDMNVQNEKTENEYFKSLYSFADLTIYRYMRFWYSSDFIFKLTSHGKKYFNSIAKLHAFTTEIIKKKIKSRKQDNNKLEENTNRDSGKRRTKAFLDILIVLSEAHVNPLSERELREQVDTFLFGAHDTTGIAISWILFCLGNNLESQKKLHEEIDEAFGGDNDEPFDKSQLTQLKYLDRVIKESLRLYPSAPYFSRRLTHDVTIDNYVIPKGVELTMEVMHLHHDPEVWDEPEKFDPDRFLPENISGRHPFAYLPFSAGPRNCIGQKFAMVLLKITVVGILKRWEVKSALKCEEMKISAKTILTPDKETVDLYFMPRIA